MAATIVGPFNIYPAPPPGNQTITLGRGTPKKYPFCGLLRKENLPVDLCYHQITGRSHCRQRPSRQRNRRVAVIYTIYTRNYHLRRCTTAIRHSRRSVIRPHRQRRAIHSSKRRSHDRSRRSFRLIRYLVITRTKRRRKRNSRSTYSRT